MTDENEESLELPPGVEVVTEGPVSALGADSAAAGYAAAQATVESFFANDDECRWALGVLADSIQIAEEVAPGKWTISLYPTHLWLNVGRVAACVINQDGVGWILHKDHLPALPDRQLHEYQEQAYKTLPNSRWIRFDSTVDPGLLDAMRPAHREGVRDAGAYLKRVWAPSARRHSPAIVEYLRKTLQRDVPDAVFDPEPPTSGAGANVWLFQANPDQYSLKDELPKLGTDAIDRWAVTDYEKIMQPGDTILLWQSGRRAGLYGRGVLTEPPFQRDWDPDPELVERQPYQRTRWWVRYRLTDIYPAHLPREAIRTDPILGQMQIFKFSRGSTFRVSPEEWSVLQTMLPGNGASQMSAPPQGLNQLLRAQLAAQGLAFTPHQIATYVTALQAKGFVILSGISGTGKTKLAQGFARLLPQPTAQPATQAAAESGAITLKPYMFRYNRLIIPKHTTRLFDPPAPGETKEVTLRFDGKQQACRLTHAAYGDTDYIALMLRGSARSWFHQTFQVDDTLVIEPEFDVEQELIGFRLLEPRAAGEAASKQPKEERPNWLFVPVRPDWRDSKSLLGYFNPLAQEYVWTDFLRFLVAADTSYRAGEALGWFVILDEMNLARVEYYFADLLSVLESGRTANGQTAEPLRLDYPKDVDGDLPPREIHLPPNLFFIGTVNMDETTHAFSPKVLDRAFTIEFTEVDFSDYPPQPTAGSGALSAQQRQQLHQAFMLNGGAGRVDKARVAATIAAYPEVRRHLQALNCSLQPFGMHFGYRVFDEVASFLAAAEQNDLFAQLDGITGAFDAAVLMKVLPKFHGSRARLEGPLRAVLSWCASPDAPDPAAIDRALETIESASLAIQRLGTLSYQYRRTAQRARRMIYSLYTDGFAAFG